MTSTQPDLTATRRYARLVRTTLRVHDDVLEAARYIATDEGVGVGDAMSRLARRGLEPRFDAPAVVNRALDD
jgi:hypothetical protein